MTMPHKLIATLSLALLSAQVQAVEFSFLNSAVTPETFGNSYTATLDALTLTATAWSTTGIRGRFQTAELEIYPGYGMGVCNRSEGVNCSSNYNAHALDNRGADDLILFTFSSSVQLDTLEFLQFGGDSDINLWAGSGPVTLDGIQSKALGKATLINNSNSSNTLRTVALGGTLTGTYDWFAVGPRINQENDFVKLSSLTVASPVPEPATWAMTLVGLGLVGFSARRRI